MRASSPVPPEQIMPRSSRHLGGGAGGHILYRDVVDRDRNIVLLSPVLGELVKPFVVCRNEVTPLHDRQRLGIGQAGDTNGAEITSAAANVRPVFFKNRRLVTRDKSARVHLRLLTLNGCQLDEAGPDRRGATPTGGAFRPST